MPRRGTVRTDIQVRGGAVGCVGRRRSWRPPTAPPQRGAAPLTHPAHHRPHPKPVVPVPALIRHRSYCPAWLGPLRWPFFSSAARMRQAYPEKEAGTRERLTAVAAGDDVGHAPVGRLPVMGAALVAALTDGTEAGIRGVPQQPTTAVPTPHAPGPGSGVGGGSRSRHDAPQPAALRQPERDGARDGLLTRGALGAWARWLRSLCFWRGGGARCHDCCCPFKQPRVPPPRSCDTCPHVQVWPGSRAH